MAKIVVTGGAGFIGTHLVNSLRELGHDVEIVDIKLDPKQDVRNLYSLKQLFIGAEYVFHMAALVSVPYSIEHPEETNETNLSGTLNVLIASKEAGVKRVIFSSTCAIYGNPEKFPINEETPPAPMSPYSMQKLASEEYLKLFSRIYNLETVSLRYFNVYGHGQSSHGAYASVIPKFIELRKLDRALSIVGDGEQTRDFVHVSDVVRANISAMESDRVGKGEVINIGYGKESSVNLIAGYVGGKIEHVPARIEPSRSLGDVSKAKLLLDWEPKMSLEEGIKKLL
ncbi:MAG: NAD-dependent epimerase/dehydratase family protein [Minisyncoccia bacterium]